MTLKRDSNSPAILNTDSESLNKYKRDRLYYKKVDQIEIDIAEIKRTVVSICTRIEKLEIK